MVAGIIESRSSQTTPPSVSKISRASSINGAASSRRPSELNDSACSASVVASQNRVSVCRNTSAAETNNASAPSSAVAAASRAFQAPEAISIQLTEFDFLMPNTIPAGVQTLHVENIGGMPHFVEFQAIGEGKTDEDIQTFPDDPAAMHGPPPAWATASHIPTIGLLSPGASTDVTIDLPPGRYAAFCWMPDAEGNPHALDGKHHVFEVVGEPTGTLPQPDFTLTWNGSELLGVPTTISPGTTATIAYENTGDKRADITAVQVLQEASPDQLSAAVDDWFHGLYAGPAPVQFLDLLRRRRAGSRHLPFRVPGPPHDDERRLRRELTSSSGRGRARPRPRVSGNR